MAYYIAKVAATITILDAERSKGQQDYTLQAGEYRLTKIPNPHGLPNHWLVMTASQRGMAVEWWRQQQEKEIEIPDGQGGKKKIPLVTLTKIEDQSEPAAA